MPIDADSERSPHSLPANRRIAHSAVAATRSKAKMSAALGPRGAVGCDAAMRDSAARNESDARMRPPERAAISDRRAHASASPEDVGDDGSARKPAEGAWPATASV